jgi:hypothetical protein
MGIVLVNQVIVAKRVLLFTTLKVIILVLVHAGDLNGPEAQREVGREGSQT